jgi:hypothetical protein
MIGAGFLFFGDVREVPFDRLALTGWGETPATDRKACEENLRLL